MNTLHWYSSRRRTWVIVRSVWAVHNARTFEITKEVVLLTTTLDKRLSTTSFVIQGPDGIYPRLLREEITGTLKKILNLL